MNSTSTTQVNCPVCKTICSEPPLYRYTASQAATHFCPITRNADRYHRLEASIRKLWQAEECVILLRKGGGFAMVAVAQ